MSDYPYGSDYSGNKKNTGDGRSTGRNAYSKMSGSDKDYMAELSSRLNSAKKPQQPPPTKSVPAQSNYRQAPQPQRAYRPTTPAKSAQPIKSAQALRKQHAPHSQSTAEKKYTVAQKKRRQLNRRPPKRRRYTFLKVASVLVCFVVAAIAIGYGLLQGKIAPGPDSTPESINTLPAFQGEEVNFVVCGVAYDNEAADAYATEEKVGTTDLMLYVRYNIKDGKINILQIPRDTYVGKTLRTGGTYKMNGVYYHSANANRMADLVQGVFFEQFGLPVDFFITVDLDALAAIINHIGYIRVYVPMEILDPDNPQARINSGWQNLEAEQVEFLVRNRTTPGYGGQNDIARMRTQQALYSALFREFKSLSSKDLFMWMSIFINYIKTDADLTKIAGIGIRALEVQGENITFIRPECGVVYYTNDSGIEYSAISLVEASFAEVITTYFNPRSAPSIYTLPIGEDMGVIPAEVKTMKSIQETEPEE